MHQGLNVRTEVLIAYAASLAKYERAMLMEFDPLEEVVSRFHLRR